MYTSILWIALAGYAAPEATAAPEWKSDYTQARREGAEKKKPLAVFLAPGMNAWEGVSEGKVSEQGKRLLAEKYVCLFADTSTEAGRSLAKLFGVGGAGLIISDKTGELQAFFHNGKVSAEDLQFYLERYSNPDRVVRDTETQSIRRVSSYAEPASSSGTRSASPTYCPS